jgi:hypothetical protein
MQQRPKAAPTPSKTTNLATAKAARPAPIVLDEKALRQIAGGMLESNSPKGGW